MAVLLHFKSSLQDKMQYKTSSKKLAEMIKNMDKIKPYIKKGADIIADAISTLAAMMQKADHFPEICNRSK